MSLGKKMWWLQCAGCVAGLGCLAAVLCGGIATASTRTRSHAAKHVVPLSPWEQAERGREALEGTPEGDRTRADYTRAMDAYRAIYHANPADVHAPAAVNAVAELLAEQGRTLHDAKSSQAAVGQYEFLRKQYPASSLGVQALLAEGQIEEDDLGDAVVAKQKYKLLLKEHPKSQQAEEAKAGLDSLEQVRGSRAAVRGKTTQSAAGSGSIVQPIHRDETAMNGAPGSVAGSSALPATVQTAGAGSKTAQGVEKPAPAANPAKGTMPTTAAAGVDLAAMDAQTRPADTDAKSVARIGKRALVTGIRHWSTATYTRVAIDLGDGVTYEAARVPNPDRIFFDLHGTRLGQELVGKSFAVTDDGFLKKIRAAQYSDDVTRVVLDVNDVTEYSAFLLPDPYRLIIDIHGGKPQSVASQAQARDTMSSSDVPAPHAAGVAKPTAARPVPNTVATRSSTSEVVDLSAMPGKVDATSKPTSKPISAVVADAGSKDKVTGSTAGSVEPTHRDETAMNGAPNAVADTSTALSAGSSKKTRKGRTSTRNAAVADATPARAAVKTADGETSLVRALGLKIGRIVIDAGHGGHDSGTLGAEGIEEKDVVLDVALRLGKLLHDRLGAEIIYTRSDDTFIPLETRTAIANKAQADLFLSIHANSSSDESARGVETYYLNFTSDPTALDVAARENAVSDQSIHQLSDLVKKIALKDKIAESREFAADVEGSLYAGLQKGNAGLKDRGVKKAPFVVLIGANMPSILAEISFVTNPKDASQLQQPEYRQRVAESLYKGVARYEGGLSATRVPTERAAVGQ